MKVKPCGHKTHTKAPSSQLDWALAQLKNQGLKVTAPRKAILGVLTKASRPLSSDEAFQAMKKGSSDLVTVYRSLTSLEEAGLLRRHDLGDGIRRYELLNEGGHHHHFIRCRDCGSVEPFDGCDFDSAITKALEARGYRRIHHSLDVQALCAKCQKETG